MLSEADQTQKLFATVQLLVKWPTAAKFAFALLSLIFVCFILCVFSPFSVSSGVSWLPARPDDEGRRERFAVSRVHI